jgi:hypothetical protein
LQATIDVEIIGLCIVLHESSPEQIGTEINFNLWCNQEKFGAAIITREFQFIII